MTELYAAPDGTGDGTPDNPMSLEMALVIGGMVNLLPGRYSGDIRIDTPSTTLRSVPGARAILDGDVQVWGDGCVLDGLEITYTGWPTRISAQSGSAPTDIPQKYLSVYGPRTRVLNCIIHDLAGCGWWKTAIDSEFAGCLISNNGWQGTDRGHGPGIYAQNDTGSKLCRDNIILPSYSFTGFQFYGTEATALLHFHIERNTIVRTRFLVGSSSTPIDDIHAIDNLLWRRDIEIGYTNALNGSAEIRGNYIGLGHILPHALTSLDMQDNTVINAGGLAVLDLQPPNAPHAYQIDGNSYLSNRTLIFWNGANVTDFAGWRAAGYDSGGTFGPLPTEPAIFVNGNIVTVFNWSNQASVPAPLSGRYTNAMNVSEQIDLEAGEPLPMASWTVATPIGADAPLVEWDSRFGVFLVETGG